MEILHTIHYTGAFIIAKYQSTLTNHMGKSNESVISTHLVKLQIEEYNNVEFLNHELIYKQVYPKKPIIYDPKDKITIKKNI